jgi:hypothetical protein
MWLILYAAPSTVATIPYADNCVPVWCKGNMHDRHS